VLLQNVASFTCQFYYSFFNSFSTETLFDSVNLTLYNITFTSLPIFVFALLEQATPEGFLP
jgi:magnesium-transporting ATPase (P-type)